MKVKLNTKEFVNILKTFAKFSKFGISNNVTVVSFVFDPEFRIVMNNDTAYVNASPEVLECEAGDPFHFKPDMILNLDLKEKEVVLSWDSTNSPLNLVCGRLSTSLRVATPIQGGRNVPEKMDSFEVPIGVLSAITQYLSVPFAYFNMKKELMPVHLRKNENGFLEALADDNYSLSKFETDVKIDKDFDVKIPKYVLDNLFSDVAIDDPSMVKMGSSGFSVFFQNKNVSAITSGVTDSTHDFDTILAKVGEWKTSCNLIPKSMILPIKQLISIIPKKDRQGSFIKVSVGRSGMSMTANHKDTGEGKIDSVDDISDVYNENSVDAYTINMHPQAFQSYTSLLPQLEMAKLQANFSSAYYESEIKTEFGSSIVKYLFPTVQV